MVHIEQSVPICLSLAATGGAIEVFATALLAYQDAQERKQGQNWSSFAKYANLGLHLVLQMASSLVGNLFAPWFGPVSLVGPVFLSAQLLTNMIVFGILLGLERFTKDMRVGTYIVAIAVVLLPIVGPTAQDDQDAMALLTTWYSLLWSGIQVVMMMVSFMVLLVWDISQFQNEWYKIGILLAARATAFTVNLTVSKVFIMPMDSLWMLGVLIVLKFASGGIITYALVIQSTAVEQAKFVPLNASALILVNAITGMVVWEDWRAVGSWIGYLSVFLQLVLGNYLLLENDVEMLSAENANYGRAKSILMAKEGMPHRHSLFLLDEDISQDEGSEEAVEKDGDDTHNRYQDLQNMTESNGPPTSIFTHTETSPRVPRRPSTAQEAWSSVYGLDRQRPRRRTSIFAMESTAQMPPTDIGMIEYETTDSSRFNHLT